MLDLIFASQNENKRKEIQNKIGHSVNLENLHSIGLTGEIPETGSTLEENALIKARFVHQRTHKSCFADDTGLEVEALNGAPGVYSARYAGESKNDENNIEKLLQELSGKNNRNAQFRTVIALILDGKEFLFEGSIKGTITSEKSGHDGFGYDPVFKPNGYNKTFAELSLEEKNKISHRAIAVQKLVNFLKEI